MEYKNLHPFFSFADMGKELASPLAWAIQSNPPSLNSYTVNIAFFRRILCLWAINSIEAMTKM